MEKKNTPMQELIEKIDADIAFYELQNYMEAETIIEGLLISRNLANDMLQAENQIVIDAWVNGNSFDSPSHAQNADDYFNQTFNSK